MSLGSAGEHGSLIDENLLEKYLVNGYLPTIGIECHVQLATKTKLFSAVDNDARDAEPNSKVSAIDYALPGMLPYLNHEAVRLAARAGAALNAEIAHESRFDRKHYFYPDLPKGYQISQMYQPIIIGGHVDLPSGERVRIHHAHLEEDAGKLTHFSDYSLVDLNRAGTPLIEIVAEPDIHSATAARIYAEELHGLMTFAGVTFGDLYYGNMRFDVNISVAKPGEKLGLRTEIKNLNSFRSVEKATEYEIQRQIAILEKGEKVVQETRGWLDDAQKTVSQRSKEDAQDYRYMPDADIPPIVLTDDDIAKMQKDMPTLPPEYRAKFAALNVDESVVRTILRDQNIAELLAEILDNASVDTAKRIANLFVSTLPAEDEESGASDDLQPTENKKYKFFIIHGTEGHPNENWFPWLKAELEKLGHTVTVPQFPSPPIVPAKISEWFDVWKKYENQIDENTVIIGHSLGCIFTLRLLEKIKKPIRAAIFVAPPVGIKPIKFYDRDLAFSGFEFDWQKIHSTAHDFVVYHSDNDPYVDIANGRKVAEKLNIEMTFVPDAGHFNKTTADYVEFPDLLEKLQNLTGDDERDNHLPSAENLIKLAQMLDKSEISSTAGKEIFVEMLKRDADPHQIAESKNLLQVSDESAISAIVDEVLSDPTCAKAVADFRAGEEKAIGFLVGQVMKASKGQANPGLAQKLIREKL